jgi:hypothetical protein
MLIWFKHCPGHNLSLKAWIGIMFHRIVTLDPRKCHDPDPRSLVKGQGHYIHSGFLHSPSHNFSLSLCIGIIFSRIVTLYPWKCHDLDPRSKVTMLIMI